MAVQNNSILDEAKPRRAAAFSILKSHSSILQTSDRKCFQSITNQLPINCVETKKQLLLAALKSPARRWNKENRKQPQRDWRRRKEKSLNNTSTLSVVDSSNSKMFN